jgi:competence protein ComEC
MADFFIGDIAFAAAIGFLAGVLSESFAWPIFWVSGILLAAGSLAAAAARRKIFLYAGVFASSIVFLGAFYFCFFTASRSVAMKLPTVAKDPFRVIVSAEPTASEKYMSFSAELQPPFAGTITVFAPPEQDIRYGDLVELTGRIAPPQSLQEGPAVFPKRVAVVSRSNGFWLQERLLDIKRAISEKFGEFLPPDSAALLGGMTLGGSVGMSAAVKGDMTASETLYVTSMYGYKIAVIIAVIDALFARFVLRRFRFCLAAAMTVLFVMMSGANSSAVRGGIMACVLMLAGETGEIFSKRNALALTAAGMAVCDPTIVAQAGFLFSFSSVAGMAFLRDPIRRFLRLDAGRGMLGWKEAVVVSLASLVPIVPLVSAMFGSFSLTAIFANVLVAGMIPLGMAAGAALAVAGFASPYLAFFVARAAGIVPDYVLWIAHVFAVHEVPLPFQFSGPVPFGLYYGLLALFIYAYGGTQKQTA